MFWKWHTIFETALPGDGHEISKKGKESLDSFFAKPMNEKADKHDVIEHGKRMDKNKVIVIIIIYCHKQVALKG